MSALDPSASATVIVREYRGQVFYEAKFRHDGRQVKRRIGPAWLERDRDPDTGGWRRHRGRVAEGAYDERAAHVVAARLVAEYVSEAANVERVELERRTRGVTFREVAHAYLRRLADVAGAKPSTLRDHDSVLAEPGIPYKRGKGTTAGHVMAALGDRPAAKITTREIEDLLATVSATGASPRTVNKYRSVIAPSSATAASRPRTRCRRTPRARPTAAASRTPERSCSTRRRRSRPSRARSPKAGTATRSAPP